MKMLTQLPALILLGGFFTLGHAQALESTQSFAFPFHAGDGLVVQNDYGSIRVEPSVSDQVEVTVRSIAASQSGLDSISVVCRKVGTRVYVQTYFFRYTAESVQILIRAPRTINVIAGGANPAVDLQDLGGFVRVQTLTGFITAANLTGSTSLFTENGDIEYNAAVQPQGDLALETIQGNIRCRLRSDLSLRLWLRAGDGITWGNTANRSSEPLERRLGEAGPLLLATSQNGSVRVALAQGPPAAAPPSERVPQRSDRGKRSATPSRTTATTQAATSEEAAKPAPDTPLPISEPAAPSETPGSVQSANVGGGSFSLKVNVNLVNVNTSVHNRESNRAVADLAIDDFVVAEDGVPQTIAKFDNTEAPFSLLLLLDVSGSTASYLRLIQQASIEFTRQIKAGDRIALATFNSRTRLRQQFTDDRQEIERALRSIRSGGGTAFYDALSASVTEFFEGQEGRKAIVVFTDGVDNRLTGDFSNGSTISFPDLFRQIKERDILIYTIFLDTEGRMTKSRIPGRNSGTLGGILGDIILGRGSKPVIGGGNVDPRAYEEARGELEEIADQTGGRMYTPTAIQDLSGVYGEIADDLRIQYTLGYYSNSSLSDGRWRQIEVTIRNRPDFVVRSRRGYYGGRN